MKVHYLSTNPPLANERMKPEIKQLKKWSQSLLKGHAIAFDLLEAYED